MWGLFVFAPFMAAHVEPWLNEHLGTIAVIGPLFTGPPIGIGMLTAGIVLGIMVIPFISSVSREVFSAVPTPLKESAVALGSTRWEILSRVTLPYTRSAIIGAIFLGLGRALGETMAVTFVLGNAHDLSASLLMPSNSIAAAIANEFAEADTDLYRSSLIALGFLLFVVTFIVLTIAKLMLMRIEPAAWEGPTDGHAAPPRLADIARARCSRPPRPLFGLSWLVWILWTTLSEGAAALTPALFTQMTPPPGSSGGLLNAFYGSAVMVLLGAR